MEDTNETITNIHLDFEQAKAKHLLFKSKLRSILYGSELIDETPVLSHYECAVGKWIYNHALKAYGHIPEMLDLEKVHADIHNSARELIAQYKEGKQDEARKGLTGMEKIADHLISLLAIVEHKLSIEVPTMNIHYDELETTRAELNDLLLANEALDKKIQQQSSELINERQLLHNFFMQAPASYCILKGPQHIYELANEEYSHITGKKNLLGKTVREVFPEIEDQGFLEILENVYKTGESFIGKETLVQINKNNDGKLHPIYVNYICQAYKNLGGETEGVIMFAYEVTEQVNARKKIAESEVQFRNIANSIPQLAWIANPDGWIYWYNQRWYDYTGTTLEEMQGWGWDKVHHPDHIEKVLNFVKEAWGKDDPFELTFPLKRSDGIYRWFLTRAYPVKDNEGKVIQWIGTNTDIDDQKKALEQKDEFMSIASHELKTPVTSLKGFTQILQMKFEKEGNKQASDLLGKMNNQIDKLTQLIIDLLDTTKIENGQLIFNLEDFNINDLALEIAEEMQRTTISHKIVTKLSKSPIVSGDRNRIGQVITNLISNAIKYSPEANKIIISSSVNNENVNFCVQDFGIGIPEVQLQNVFDRFYRVGGENRETFPGLGLGLFISKEIIKRHQGNISAQSNKKNGTVFCFTLPVKKL